MAELSRPQEWNRQRRRYGFRGFRQQDSNWTVKRAARLRHSPSLKPTRHGARGWPRTAPVRFASGFPLPPGCAAGFGALRPPLPTARRALWPGFSSDEYLPAGAQTEQPTPPLAAVPRLRNGWPCLFCPPVGSWPMPPLAPCFPCPRSGRAQPGAQPGPPRCTGLGLSCAARPVPRAAPVRWALRQAARETSPT